MPTPKRGRPFKKFHYFRRDRMVKCNKCGLTILRYNHDDDSYGDCPNKCEGARMIPEPSFADRKLEKARDEMKKWGV